MSRNVIITPETPQNDNKKSRGEVIAPGGRGGWRHRAEQLSKSTVPGAPDSVNQLEQRVKAAGGKVDAQREV